ncbi:MAG: aminoglycoside phosphotransferase family protein [Oscillospiraceae bacterium]|jgi:serine/threonine protein kinase|nr:aminoglycoside phosphotransferase family protein [Oscillospiraceae bacterium]
MLIKDTNDINGNSDVKLHGFSGCKITKNIDCSGVPYVKKISASIDYNPRLKSSIEKQKYFNTINSSSVLLAPEIIDTYFENGLYCTDMEYCEETHLPKSKFSDNMITAIMDFIQIAKSNLPFEKINCSFRQAMYLKIESLIPYLSDGLKTLIKRVFETNLPILNPTFCHGDFTLENILISDKGEVRLIDFLDCYYPHYYLDIAKLYQIIEADWLRIKKGIEPKMNSGEYDFLRKPLDIWIKAEYPEYAKIHYFLLGVTLMRIIPYAPMLKTKIILEKEIVKYINLYLEGKTL